MDQIKSFEDLIRGYIGPDKTVVDTRVSNVTAPGENYMSEIIRIQVFLKNKTTGLEEELWFVAKLVIDVPIAGGGTNAILTKNEVNFYKDVVPAIEDFQKKRGLPTLDIFPKFIAGRINLNGSDIADENAVLILEDLARSGYKNLDRLTGFDFNGAKLVIHNLATLHAELLAMRILEPEKYEVKIRSNCRGLKPNATELSKRSEFFTQPVNLFTLVEDILKTDEECIKILPSYTRFIEKLKVELEKNTENFFGKLVRDQFETLVHYDVWTNNIMQTFEDRNRIKTVFVDLQMYRSISCACDVVFFLITSVQMQDLRSNFDNFLKFYYDIFNNILNKAGIFDSKYSYDEFLKSFERVSEPALYQLIFMILSVIFPKTKVGGNDQMYSLSITNVSQTAKDKLIFTFKEAFNRGWLK